MIRRSLTTGYGTLLVFCFLFSFRLPLIYTSSAFACAVAIAHLALNPPSYRRLRSYILNKYYLGLNAVVLAFFLYSMAVTVAHGEYDFSFLSLAVSYLFYAFATPLVFAAISSGRRTDVENYIVYAFFIQSFIILLAFFIPALRDALRIFKDESQLELADTYYGGGLRGLALSGGLFFSLSCGYCLYFMVVVRRLAEQRCSYLFLGAVLVSMFSAVTAGRTALIGMTLAIGILMYQRFFGQERLAPKANIRRVGAILLLLVAVVLIAVPYKYLETAFESYMRFSFEMVFNVLEGKGLTTSSTDVLNQMYFPLDAAELTVGDGRYSSVGGGYFRQTDAGYMRNILLGGLPIVLFALGHVAWWFASMQIYRSPEKGRRYGETVFAASIVLMILILHYKGEAMLYVIMINNILYLLFFDQMVKRKNYTQAKKPDSQHCQNVPPHPS